jgi:hypothetical protein
MIPNDFIEMQNLFNKILNSNVIVKDNIDGSKDEFVELVESLKSTFELEKELNKTKKHKLNKVIDLLWDNVSLCLGMLYGKDITYEIYHYISSVDNRYKNIDELWEFVKEELEEF